MVNYRKSKRPEVPRSFESYIVIKLIVCATSEISNRFIIGIWEKQIIDFFVLISAIQYSLWRVSRSLIWHIIEEILAKHGFKEIIQISQFVELAFILRKKCVKIVLHANTPRHISETGRPKSKRKIYLLSGFILK